MHTYQDFKAGALILGRRKLELPPNGAVRYATGNRGLDNYATDYVIGRSIIYAAFAWSVAEKAYKVTYELAEKYEVGFFDVSSEKGNIFFPENGKLKKI